jgi:hypothetical protein
MMTIENVIYGLFLIGFGFILGFVLSLIRSG